MGSVLGIHGIAQQQLGRLQLERTWLPAMCDGIERATGEIGLLSSEFRIAFYGDLFLPPAGADKSRIIENLSRHEEAFLDEAVSELEGHLTAAQETAKMRLPSVIPRAIARLDALIGAEASAILEFGDLVQVRRYLLDPGLKAKAEHRVDAAASDGINVLVGHSLGSVVALEYLRTRPEFQVDLFLTLGSPLAFRCVRSLLPDPAFALNDLPDNIGRWVNVYDPRDIVACKAPLSRLWRAVEDLPVNNGSSPHDVARYLAKKESGGVIARAMGLEVE
jgi:hypothetical protein